MKDYKELKFLTELSESQIKIIDTLTNDHINLNGLAKLIDFIINNKTLQFKWNEQLNYFEILLNNSVLLWSKFFKLTQYTMEEIQNILSDYFYIVRYGDDEYIISTEDTYL